MADPTTNSKAPYRILVVDDEADFRALVRNRFRRGGHRVLEAGDGVEALEVFDDADPIDLVITDIRMPRMDGEQLIRELRLRRSALPIIGVTGHADLQGKLALLGQGAYYYVDKPLPDLAFLERLVENAIRLYRHEQEIELQRARELQVARLMRAYILEGPAHFADGNGPSTSDILDIAIEPIETHRPGGDYVEWFARGEEEILFYMADARGHDISAAFAACLSNMVLHRSHHGRRPAVDVIIRTIDGALDRLRSVGAFAAGDFLSFFIATLHLPTGRLNYVNAGHPEAFVVRDGRAIGRLRSTSGSVGHLALIGADIEVGAIPLEKGDLVFVYSDGASEMLETETGSKAEGIDRLATAVEAAAHLDVAEVLASVKDFLHGEAGEAGFDDDVTLMALRFLGLR